MTARRKRFFAASLGILVLLAAWILLDGSRPYLASASPSTVEISPGTSTLKIAEQLEYAGAIRSRLTFLWLHYLHPDQTLKAGEYVFDRPASVLDVLRKLVRGEVATQALTIPEGLTRFEIADIVQTAGLATRKEFLAASANAGLVADLDPHAANLEGYLFPDTYLFPRRYGAARIVKTMTGRFRQVYSGLAAGAETRPVRDIVTMASMVEEETWKADERPLVASVFYNRLERHIPLQCDPTVAYAALLENKYDGKLGLSDLKLISPYNTYLNPGLPPGPITNPGKGSLQAALRPAASDYIYFVANPEGNHTFSKTLREHNAAVGVYRQSLARQIFTEE